MHCSYVRHGRVLWSCVNCSLFHHFRHSIRRLRLLYPPVYVTCPGTVICCTGGVMCSAAICVIIATMVLVIFVGTVAVYVFPVVLTGIIFVVSHLASPSLIPAPY